MRKIFIVILLSILLACNNSEDVPIVDLFKTTQPIIHKIFDVQNGLPEFLAPFHLEITGNTMTIRNLFMSEKMFTTIDIATGRVIKNWGEKGQGPNEFQGLIDIYYNYSETGLNIWDSRTLKLYFCSNSNLESDSVYFQEIPITMGGLERKDFFVVMRTAVQIDTSLFFVLAGNGNKIFTLLDTNSSEKKEIGDYPSEDNLNNKGSDLHTFHRNMAYQGRIRYNKSLKKLVYASRYSEMFEIYNVDGTNVKLAMGNYSTIPKYKEIVSPSLGRSVVYEDIKNGKGRNLWLTVSEKNIFILYQDYSKKEAIDVDGTVKEIADMVLVFDWDGKPIKAYTLDCFIQTISYDKTTNRLYAIHHNPYPEIIYFDLE